MIRATAISIVDQGLLSAVNFGLALALIRFGSPDEYGLYTQLVGLQTLASVLHTALFVSAFLAMLPRLDAASRRAYQAGMARAEVIVTIVSALAVAALTWLVANGIGHALTLATSAAAALALLGLWWREFTRARYFADGDAGLALRLDAAYALLVVGGVTALIVERQATAANLLWCVGIAGLFVAVRPIVRQSRIASVDAASLRADIGRSWRAARWEVLISLVSWGHAQSFVYFAAAQGGLGAAAEISAARLLTMPLALVWQSYANILRPEASRLLESSDAARELPRLAARSVAFVVGLALAYGLVLVVAMPLLDRLLFTTRFEHVHELALLWLAYFSLTGLTTIATSLLRSAFEFKALFRVHAVCSVIAVATLCVGLTTTTPAAFVIALVVVEALLAALSWRLLRQRLDTAARGSLAWRTAHGG